MTSTFCIPKPVKYQAFVDGEVKLYEARKQLAFLNAPDFAVMATYKNQFATINAKPFWQSKLSKLQPQLPSVSRKSSTSFKASVS